jgi:hypothetical protein
VISRIAVLVFTVAALNSTAQSKPAPAAAVASFRWKLEVQNIATHEVKNYAFNEGRFPLQTSVGDCLLEVAAAKVKATTRTQGATLACADDKMSVASEAGCTEGFSSHTVTFAVFTPKGIEPAQGTLFQLRCESGTP